MADVSFTRFHNIFSLPHTFFFFLNTILLLHGADEISMSNLPCACTHMWLYHCGRSFLAATPEKLTLSGVNVRISSGSGAYNSGGGDIFDENENSYWYSNSSVIGSHWIEIVIPDEFEWSDLSIFTQNHETYSPERIRIKSDSVVIKEVTLSKTPQWVDLVTSEEAEAAGITGGRTIRIEILSCHGGGYDTRIACARVKGIPRGYFFFEIYWLFVSDRRLVCVYVLFFVLVTFSIICYLLLHFHDCTAQAAVRSELTKCKFLALKCLLTSCIRKYLKDTCHCQFLIFDFSYFIYFFFSFFSCYSNFSAVAILLLRTTLRRRVTSPLWMPRPPWESPSTRSRSFLCSIWPGLRRCAETSRCRFSLLCLCWGIRCLGYWKWLLCCWSRRLTWPRPLLHSYAILQGECQSTRLFKNNKYRM